MSTRTWIKQTYIKAFLAIKSGFDIRDFFVFGGLAMMGYGLYLFLPWLAFTVCGALLMAAGLCMGRGE